MPAPRSVRNAFGRHAEAYDDLVVVQRRVRDRIRELCRTHVASPGVVVDIGAGTGSLLNLLRTEYPTALLVPLDAAYGMMSHAYRELSLHHAVTADAEALPLRSAVADLVISSSAFQWLDSLDTAFREVCRILLPGGVFIFSFFGSRTLRELRDSYRRAVRQHRTASDRTRTFHSGDEAATAAAAAGLKLDSLWTETEEELYLDVQSLIRSIRGIGANTPRSRPSSLAERGVMRDMIEIYRRVYGRDGMIPATYDVIYGIARRPPSLPDDQGE